MILELIAILAFTALVFHRLNQMGGSAAKQPATATRKVSPQLEQTLAYAERLYGEHKYLAAEKAYLSVLKQDHRNQTAYAHLGKIYAALGNHADSIECFRILTQLAPSAKSHFGLGMAYYDNKSYNKAATCFERAVAYEPSANRMTALARTYQKLGQWPKALAMLEQAAQLAPDVTHLSHLYDAYKHQGKTTDAAAIQKRIHDLGKPAPKSVEGATTSLS